MTARARTATLPRASRTLLPLLNIGANRGARENLAAFERFNRESSQFALAPRYADPIPGRARGLADYARQRGVEATAIEARGEEALRQAPAGDTTPVLANVDRPTTVADILRAAGTAKRPILGYLVVRFPDGTLWGFRFLFQPHEETAREEAIRLFHRLGELTARRGAAEIFGSRGASAHLASEPGLRRWFASHATENLAKLTSGIEANVMPLEATDDSGQSTMPVIVYEHEDWRDPSLFVERLAENPPIPLMRGERFVVAEVTPMGIRFHVIVNRRVDGELVLRGGVVLDRATAAALLAAENPAGGTTAIAGLLPAGDATTGRQALAPRTTQAATITRRAPVVTTD